MMDEVMWNCSMGRYKSVWLAVAIVCCRDGVAYQYDVC